ncbi:MAG TPA: hypothetical protein VJR92_01110 [Gemmatimonadaceae bacterium]|nr:hypothetical protein [Gemmatimonadaceae bacterium]
MFDIAFESDTPELQDAGEEEWLALTGRIVIGDHAERFLAPVAFWSKNDYERHWLHAARRLLTRADRTAFFTSTFQFWWVMWRVNDVVFVQEQMLLADELPQPFAPNDPYRHIRDRTNVSRDGKPISEWQLAATDLRDFVARRFAAQRTLGT